MSIIKHSVNASCDQQLALFLHCWSMLYCTHTHTHSLCMEENKHSVQTEGHKYPFKGALMFAQPIQMEREREREREDNRRSSSSRLFGICALDTRRIEERCASSVDIRIKPFPQLGFITPCKHINMICSSNSGFGLQSETTGVFERGDHRQTHTRDPSQPALTAPNTPLGYCVCVWLRVHIHKKLFYCETCRLYSCSLVVHHVCVCVCVCLHSRY